MTARIMRLTRVEEASGWDDSDRLRRLREGKIDGAPYYGDQVSFQLAYLSGGLSGTILYRVACT